MSSQDYFQIYIDIIADTFRRVRKVNFKKFSILKDLVDTVEGIMSHIFRFSEQISLWKNLTSQLFTCYDSPSR